MKNEFIVSILSREDFEEVGFDASNVDDETIQRIADKLGDLFCDQMFWPALVYLATDHKIPHRKHTYTSKKAKIKNKL